MGKLAQKMMKKGGKKRKSANVTEKVVEEVLPPAKILRTETDSDVYVKKVCDLLILNEFSLNFFIYSLVKMEEQTPCPRFMCTWH